MIPSFRYPPPTPLPSPDRGSVRALVAALIAMTVAIYWQTGSFPAVDFDDSIFINPDPTLSSGLGVAGIRWAFTQGYFANWIPLSVLSHLADVTLFGKDAGKHHLVSVAFHLMNGLLLFAALRKMTGRTLESWMVAALFLAHPLHVESVAWIAERKDVLSTFFWFAAILAYIAYAERPSPVRYGGVTLLLLLGLLSKQMLVTFPFTLLLLDYWPLKRFEKGDARTLWIEKIPLIALSAAACLVAYRFQELTGAVTRTDSLPLAYRAGNALMAWTGYLVKTAWPAGLAAYYPHPGMSISPAGAVGAGACLLAISAATLHQLRRRPYLATGWAWYLGTLMPVIGLIQIGGQSMADRYTYVPLVGIFVAVVWSGSELIDRLKIPKAAVAAVMAASLASLGFAAWAQTRYWRSTEALFTRALAVTENNWFAHQTLGRSAVRAGKDNDAIAHFLEVIRTTGGTDISRNGLGTAFARAGRLDEAIGQFRIVLVDDPDDSDANYNLAVALQSAGRSAEALPYFEQAFRNPPPSPDPAERNNIGLALARGGRLREAAACFLDALRINPDDPESNYNYAVLLEKTGRKGDALPHFVKALELRAEDAKSRKQLGIALTALGRLEEAEKSFRAATVMAPDDPEARFNLGASLERQGKSEEALAQYRETLRIAPGDRDALDRIRKIRSGPTAP